VAERQIIWTELAAKHRREILRYWTNRNKSSVYAEKLIKLIAARTKIIAEYPESYIETSYPDTRTSAMGHFSIIYKLTDTELIILAFWDNRQDPKKLLDIIKK
jgi:plasmid stabilization system protein ParE